MADRPAGWSEGQLRTLADLFAAVVEPVYEGESRRHAELAAEALAEVADPADLRQVRLTLSVLGSRFGAPLLAQRRSADREDFVQKVARGSVAWAGVTDLCAIVYSCS